MGCSERGFSLVEVLIVMTLMGTLVGILLPRYQDLTPDARIAATQANLHSLRSAVTLYAGKMRSFPPNLDSLVSKGFIRKIPKEMINNTNSVIVDPPGNPDFNGGWVYFSRTGDVLVNENDLSELIPGSSINPYEDW